jgi:CheY-like chemotaxis protein/anti-sigma regulatory factor (Ser/Thr protein kinase)
MSMHTILVVDDDAKARDVAAHCLREHGMTPVFAENGREALRVLEELEKSGAGARPDAVLTDLNMPEMNGLELVETMRRDRPEIPVVLMTSRGSEEDAVAALRAGALSYVPKRELRGSLCNAMRTVVAAVQARRRHARAIPPEASDDQSHFVLGYEMDAVVALVSALRANLERRGYQDETVLFQVTTALGEAFSNAIDHGNLELDSSLRERRDGIYEKLRQERAKTQPYRDRRVHVVERFSNGSVTYVISDEGRGFDVSSIPDPTNPENLLRASGRGLMLIRTFMDEVTFNESGSEITMTKHRDSA